MAFDYKTHEYNTEPLRRKRAALATAHSSSIPGQTLTFGEYQQSLRLASNADFLPGVFADEGAGVAANGIQGRPVDG